LQQGISIQESKITVKDYFKEWLSRRHNLSQNTKKLYKTFLNNHLNFFENVQLNDVTPLMVQRFIDSLHQRYSSGYVKRIYSILRKGLNDAVNLELIRRNVADQIEKPREQREKPIEVFTVEELKEFIKIAEKTTRYAIAFKILAHTGMRRGELLALTWDDIDFERKTIRINKTLLKHQRTIQHSTKTKQSTRVIAISNYLVEELKKHKQIQEIEKAENENYEDNNLVICTVNGTSVYVDNLTRAFRNTYKKMKLEKDITLHSLRHTHATLLLQQNVHMKVVSERLGHASIKMTMDTYSHLLPSIQETAAEKFEQLFEEE
jgi:integrase